MGQTMVGTRARMRLTPRAGAAAVSPTPFPQRVGGAPCGARIVRASME